MRSAIQAAIAALGDKRPAAAADDRRRQTPGWRNDTPPHNRIPCHVINFYAFNMRRFIAASVGRLAALVFGWLVEGIHEKRDYRAFFYGYFIACLRRISAADRSCTRCSDQVRPETASSPIILAHQ